MSSLFLRECTNDSMKLITAMPESMKTSLPLKFTIPLNPVTKKNSPRVIHAGKFHKVLPSKAFETYQDKAGWHIPCKWVKIEQRVTLTARFYMGRKGVVDLGNLLNGLCDVLVHYGVILDDCNAIVFSHDGSRVFYDKEKPRTEVEIVEEEDDKMDC